MKGALLPDGDIEGLFEMPGAYGRNTDGGWYAVTPNGQLANLSGHTVMQHDDGTISVSPSILVHARVGVHYAAAEREVLVASHSEAQVLEWERGRPGWHGALERGVWREY